MSEHQTTPADARRQAEAEAKIYGCGYLLVRPNGSVERIDPARVIIKPETKPTAE